MVMEERLDSGFVAGEETYLFSAHFRISSAERYDARYAFKIFENNRFPIMSVRGRRLLIKRIPACS